MKIEIKGTSFINKGAELMLEAIYAKLTEYLNGDFETVLPPRGSPYPNRTKYRAYQKIGGLRFRVDWYYLSKLVPKKIRTDLGLVTHDDIDVVLDSSGFAYGDQWTPSMLASAVRQAEITRRNGGLYIFMPQAMGPFSSKKYRRLITRAIMAASLVYLRDEVSYDHVTSVVGERDNILLSPDFTNLLVPDISNKRSDKKVCVVIPNVRMQHKTAKNVSNAYVDVLISSIKFMLDRGFSIDILNHEGVDDLKICNTIYTPFKYNKEVCVVDGLSALEAKKRIGLSDLCISSRFHGCVSALSQGVPAIGTSWSHKYEMLFSDYGVPDLVYKFDGSVTEVITSILHRYDQYKNVINKKSIIEKKKVEMMWEGIFSCISDRYHEG